MLFPRKSSGKCRKNHSKGAKSVRSTPLSAPFSRKIRHFLQRKKDRTTSLPFCPEENVSSHLPDKICRMFSFLSGTCTYSLSAPWHDHLFSCGKPPESLRKTGLILAQGFAGSCAQRESRFGPSGERPSPAPLANVRKKPE